MFAEVTDLMLGMGSHAPEVLLVMNRNTYGD